MSIYIVKMIIEKYKLWDEFAKYNLGKDVW